MFGMFKKPKEGERNRRHQYEHTSKGKLGEGGCGVVYSFRDINTNELVAVKIVTNVSAKNEELALLEKLSRNKADSSKRVQSPYITEYKEAFFVEQQYEHSNLTSMKHKGPGIDLWLVLEFCEYGDLYHISKRLKRNFTIEEVKHIMASVVLGLKFIHSKKIVHRDIKALNILMTRAGKIKICDFGRAVRYTAACEDTEYKRITDQWMAPEMFSFMPYGYAVDIWALGITGIELLTGDTPFADLEKGMIDGKIGGLIYEKNLQTQRFVLKLDPPPPGLVKKSQGNSNNYRGYYDTLAIYEGHNDEEEFDDEDDGAYEYFPKKDNGSIYTEDEEEEEIRINTVKQFSNLKLSMDVGSFGGNFRDFFSNPLKTTNSFGSQKTGTTQFTRLGKANDNFLEIEEDKEELSDGSNATFVDKTVKKNGRSKKFTGFKKRAFRKSRRARSTGVKETTEKKKKQAPKKNPRASARRPVGHKASDNEDAPLSFVVKQKKGLKAKKATAKKKKSLIGELFQNAKSSLIRRENVRHPQQALEDEKLMLRRSVKKTKRRYSFKQIALEPLKVQSNEFLAWCLTVDDARRPSAIELTDHPFIYEEIGSLIRSECTDCGIREHSDFLLRADDLSDSVLRQEELEEEESDDDKFLSPSSLKNEIFMSSHELATENEVCTCSVSQNYLRESVIKDINSKISDSKVTKSKNTAGNKWGTIE